MNRFGDKLRELRTEMGLTQFQIAERVGVSNAYISALESGRKPAPPHAVVTAIAATLRVDESMLWDLARAEREERLKQRIDGQPTSLRVRVEPPSPEAAASNQRASASSIDGELTAVFQTLQGLARHPSDRRRLIRSLRGLLAALEDEA